MCGIVGVTGNSDANALIVEGLARLEYRGYDSAGVALMAPQGDVARYRAVGKVAKLREMLTDAKPAETGIGHTRWATHGAASDNNAHPHVAGSVYIVHNGIIENYKAIRSELESSGVNLSSDTDTELVAHLIRIRIDAGMMPADAFRDALKQLKGAFALAVVIEGRPDLLLGARRGSPLVVGTGKGFGCVASDEMAFNGAVDNVMFLDEGDVVEITPTTVSVTDLDGTPLQRQARPAATDLAIVQKGDYRHFMEKEIHEQPEVVGYTAAHYLDVVEDKLSEIEGFDFSKTDTLHIIACGTASYAGEVMRYWLETTARLRVQVDIASEFRYRQPVFAENDIGLVISQSGETADTLEAMRLCKAAGLQTIALVNAPHSTMAREADLVVPTLAGPEIGVASTKAFTCQLAALRALALLAARQRGKLSEAEEVEAVRDLKSVPAAMVETLAQEGKAEEFAAQMVDAKTVLYLGRQQFFPLAKEAALKLKEISYINSEGYASGELKHGPIALIEPGIPVVTFAPSDELFDKTRSSIRQVVSRGARVFAITDAAGAEALGSEVEDVIILPKIGHAIAPIVASVAIQLIAYHAALLKGTDVDQPRNLAKSVTVE